MGRVIDEMNYQGMRDEFGDTCLPHGVSIPGCPICDGDEDFGPYPWESDDERPTIPQS